MWRAFIRLVHDVCAVPAAPVAPDGAVAEVIRAAPGWWRYRVTLWILVRFVVLVLVASPFVVIELVAASKGMPAPAHAIVRALEYAAGGLWLLSLPIGLALARVDYEHRWYLVTDRSVRIREGVVIVHEMTLTFANVQNVTIEQGPLQRAFGISDVRVQTAGGGAGSEQPGIRSMHTGILRGIENAAAFREAVLARLRATVDAGLGDPDEDAAHPPAPALADAAIALLVEARALARAAERLPA
jgi:uncharacterized membrane protein YdbT with pleckstrin-like domain